MGAQKVLFIGGTGRISWWCVDAAVRKGFEVHVLNRGETGIRPLPAEVRVLKGNVRDRASVAAAVEGLSFDSVVNFVAYDADDVQADLGLFRGRTGQYVFISSASAYQTPPARLPVIESTPLENPIWAYSQKKIAAEDALVRAYRAEGYPVTIVRPSHTYDQASVPMIGQWTSVERMRRGRPVIVHGDGSSLWTLTHARDFAKGFVGLICNPRAYGESFHITSDEAPCWNTDRADAGARRRGRAPGYRARAVRRDRRRRQGLGRRAARRHGAQPGLRQRQAAAAGAGLRLHHELRRRSAGNRRLVRCEPRHGRSATGRRTRRWTGWLRLIGRGVGRRKSTRRWVNHR